MSKGSIDVEFKETDEQGRTRVEFAIPKELALKIEKTAKLEGRSMSDQVVAMIRSGVKKLKGGEE